MALFFVLMLILIFGIAIFVAYVLGRSNMKDAIVEVLEENPLVVDKKIVEIIKDMDA